MYRTLTLTAWTQAGCPREALLRKATIVPRLTGTGPGPWIEISNAAVDRHNDTVAVNGWELMNYLNNPVVLFGHDYSQLPIGRTDELRTEESRLLARPSFPSKDAYPFGACCGALFEAGYLNAASVGFVPLEWTFDEKRGGYNFQKQELLEWSLCNIPANPLCLSEAKQAGIDLAPMVAWAEQTLQDNAFDTLCYSRPQVERLAKTLGSQRSYSIPKLGSGWPTQLPNATAVVDRTTGVVAWRSTGSGTTALTAPPLPDVLPQLQSLERVADTCSAYGRELQDHQTQRWEHSSEVLTQLRSLYEALRGLQTSQRTLASLLEEVRGIVKEAHGTAQIALDTPASTMETLDLVAACFDDLQRAAQPLADGLATLVSAHALLQRHAADGLEAQELLTQSTGTLLTHQEQLQTTLAAEVRHLRGLRSAAGTPPSADPPPPEMPAVPPDDEVFLTFDDDEPATPDSPWELDTEALATLVMDEVQAGIRAALGRVE